jgi:hypothetical protein
VTASETARDRLAELTASLRLARREVKLARGEQEVAVETLQRVRRQRAALRYQVRLFSDALAALLSERYWEAGRAARRGPLGRTRKGRTAEQDLVAEVEASELFDGGWYLRHNPEVVEAGLSPALHYVRTGAAAGRDPGPAFDTVSYLREHPDACETDLPPLLHHLRPGPG